MDGYNEILSLHPQEDIPMETNEDGGENPLDWLDYVVFSSTLIIALLIGVYHSYFGQNTTSDYLLGQRQLRVLPVGVSIFMSVISGITVLGTSAEMYIYGTQLWLDSVAKSIFYAVSAYLYVPLMYKLKLTSIYEYHALRFKSPILHKVCVTVGIVVSVMYMGIAMYAPSTALEAVTGFPVWASLICIGVIAVIYTTIGGIKAVVWTDFFQGFILFGGLVVILVVGCIRVGGLDTVWQISKEGGRINFFDMNPDPTERATFWTVMIGSGIMSITKSATDQSNVQRYCSLSNMKQAVFVVLLQIPLLLLVYFLVCLCGLTVYAYYDLIGCDPYRSQAISNTNQLLPYFVVDAIAIRGFSGLFIAILFSGALSSISSSMNGLAAVTWKDILHNYVKDMSEQRKTLVTKMTSFLFGVIGIGVGFAMQYSRSNVMQLTTIVLNGLSAPTTGVVVAGSLIPWVTAKGSLIGMAAGYILIMWINIGQLIYYPHRTYLDTTVTNCSLPANSTILEIPSDPDGVFWLYSLSFQYVPLASLITTIAVAFVASLIMGKQDPQKLDPRSFIDLHKKCGCCCSNCSCDQSNEKSVWEEKDDKVTKIDEVEYGDKCYHNDSFTPEKECHTKL